MKFDNGILASVPGDCVAQGMQQLPNAESATHEQVIADLDAREAGCVRITYRRRCLRHRKLTHWYWHAVRADPLPNPLTEARYAAPDPSNPVWRSQSGGCSSITPSVVDPRLRACSSA